MKVLHKIIWGLFGSAFGCVELGIMFAEIDLSGKFLYSSIPLFFIGIIFATIWMFIEEKKSG